MTLQPNKESKMDKGIRPACNAKFVELLPQRVEMGNTSFRKTVMAYVMEEFGITLASAATHYNHAFKTAKEAGVDCGDLGRPEDKKGGRKPKVRASESDDTNPWPWPVSPKEEAAPVEAVATVEAVENAEAVQQFVVTRKKDGAVVGMFSSQAEAEELIAKAKAAKKATLVLA